MPSSLRGSLPASAQGNGTWDPGQHSISQGHSSQGTGSTRGRPVGTSMARLGSFRPSIYGVILKEQDPSDDLQGRAKTHFSSSVFSSSECSAKPNVSDRTSNDDLIFRRNDYRCNSDSINNNWSVLLGSPPLLDNLSLGLETERGVKDQLRNIQFGSDATALTVVPLVPVGFKRLNLAARNHQHQGQAHNSCSPRPQPDPEGYFNLRQWSPSFYGDEHINLALTVTETRGQVWVDQAQKVVTRIAAMIRTYVGTAMVNYSHHGPKYPVVRVSPPDKYAGDKDYHQFEVWIGRLLC
ncbi:hypothetical protein C8J56DRAFT_904594 [Mycena floridula]|nr:hypothetical protein C8J56DRAFT_904594 [Mycena floridula]